MIRTCQPQQNGSGTPRTGKSDSTLYSNKVHTKHLIYENDESQIEAVTSLFSTA